MQIFNLTLKQMLMMFTLILVGFLLRKKSKLPENAGTCSYGFGRLCYWRI